MRSVAAESICRITEQLLDVSKKPESLRPEVLELASLFSESPISDVNRSTDIAAGESRTPDGLALSPAMAAMCVDDFLRTIQFLRGTRAAILQQRNRSPERPARVLYVGCGPFATLATPLMCMLGPDEVQFTLLDVHRESVDKARALIERLGLSQSVQAIEQTDGGEFLLQPDQQPDIILMEIMQACLRKEPQVAVSRHLLQQAPEAILIPERVQIDLEWVNLAAEFDSGNNCAGNSKRDRIPIQTVFALDSLRVSEWSGQGSQQLPGTRVEITELPGPQYRPMLFTRIKVFGEHWIRDYESGLTCPQVLSYNGRLEPGTTLEFAYQLGQDPELRCNQAD